MTFVQGTGNVPSPGSTSATTIAQAYGSNNTAGSNLLAFITWSRGSSATITGVADTRGNAWTQLGATIADTTNGQNAALFVAYNVTAGANTVTATLSASSTFRGLIVEEYSAVGSSAVLSTGQQATNTTATDNTTSGTITTTTNNRQIAAFVVNTSSLGTVSAGTGFTSRVNITTVVPMRAEDLIQSSAGAIAGTFTIGTAGQYIAFVVGFAPPYTSSLTGALSFVGSQSKKTSRLLSAAMSFVGNLTTVTPIRFDAASSSGYEAALSSYSWNHTCSGTNRGLLVNISVFAAGSVTNVTYNSVGMRFIRADTIGVYRNEVWALEAPASGTHAIAVTLSTSLTSIGTGTSYRAVNQTDMVQTSGAASGSGVSTPSVSILPVDDASWVWSGLTTSDGTETVGGGATQRANNAGALGTGAISDLGPISPASTQTMSWSAVTITDSWVLAGVVLDPLAGTVYAQALFAALSFVGAQAKASSRSLTAALSFVGSQSKRTARSFTAALSFVGSLAKGTTRSLPGGLSFSGAFSKRAGKNLTAGLTSSGTISRRTGHGMTAGLAPAGVLNRVMTRAMTASMSFVGATAKLTSRLLPSAALSFVGGLSKRTARVLAAGFAPVGALNRAVTRTLAGSLSFVGAVNKRTARTLTAASMSFAGNVSRLTARALSAAMSFVGNLTPVKIGGGTVYTKTLTASLSFVGAQAKSTLRSFAGAGQFVGALNRRTARLLPAAMAFAGSASRSTARALTATLTTSGTLARRTARQLPAAALTFTGAVSRRTFRGVTGIVSFAGAQSKQTGKALAAALGPSGVLNRRIPVRFVAAIAFTGKVSKRTARALTAALSFVGHISKILRRPPRKLDVTAISAPSRWTVEESPPRWVVSFAPPLWTVEEP